MSLIGIDFGNANCIAACVSRGNVDVALNEASMREIPNVICFQDQKRLIGGQAYTQMRSNLKSSVTGCKRLLGLKFDDPEAQEELKYVTYQPVRLANGDVGFSCVYNGREVSYSIEQLAAMVFTHIGQVAKTHTGAPSIGDVVVTVPVWFTSIQRKALLRSLDIAGLTAVCLVNEHTAAAVAHFVAMSSEIMSSPEKTRVMFVDWGESQACVSVFSYQAINNEINITCEGVEWDKHMGGRFIDIVLARRLSEIFSSRNKGLTIEVGTRAWNKLVSAAEKAKMKLSPTGVSETHISIECLYQDVDFSYKLTSIEMDGLIAPDITKMMEMINRQVGEGINSMQLVGGTSRMDLFRRRLSGFNTSTRLSICEVYAKNAIFYASIQEFSNRVKLSFGNYAVKIVECFPYGHLCLNHINNEQVIIIRRNDEWQKKKKLTLGFDKSTSLVSLVFHIDNHQVELAQEYSFPPAANNNDNDSDVEVIVSASYSKEMTIFEVTRCQLVVPIKEDEPAADASSSMTTDDDEKKKKKKFMKVDMILNTNASIDLSSYKEVEVGLRADDLKVIRLGEFKYNVESLIYEVSSLLADTSSLLFEYDDDAGRSSLSLLVSKASTTLENSFDGGDINHELMTFEKTNNDLKLAYDAIKSRKTEFETFPAKQSEFCLWIETKRSAVVRQRLPDDDDNESTMIDGLRKLLDDAESWLWKRLDDGSMNANSKIAGRGITVHELDERLQKVDGIIKDRTRAIETSRAARRKKKEAEAKAAVDKAKKELADHEEEKKREQEASSKMVIDQDAGSKMAVDNDDDGVKDSDSKASV